VHEENFFLQNTPALVLGVKRRIFGLAVKDGCLRIFEACHQETFVTLDVLAQMLVPGVVLFGCRFLGLGDFVREQRTERVIHFFVIAVPHAAVERTVFLCVVAMV
jgi:hypothetical protein